MRIRGAAYGLVYTLLALGLSGCDAALLDGLDEPQANDLLVYLSAVDISAEKRGRLGRFTVSVARDDFPAAWRIARAQGLPRQAEPSPGGLLAGPRPGAERSRRASAIAALLRVDPAITDARVVLGDRGAAVSLRAPDPSTVDRARVEARVRAVSGFEADEPIAVDVHALAAPTPSERPGAGATTGAGPPTGLWLASVAVGLMLVGCGLLAWRMRRRRPSRAIHI